MLPSYEQEQVFLTKAQEVVTIVKTSSSLVHFQVPHVFLSLGIINHELLECRATLHSWPLRHSGRKTLELTDIDYYMNNYVILRVACRKVGN